MTNRLTRELKKPLLRCSVRLVYPTVRMGHWWVDGGKYVWPIKLIEYAKDIWRLSMVGTGLGVGRYDIREDVRQRLPPHDRFKSLEISFLPEELSQVVSWAVPKLEEPVFVVPEWLEERWKSHLRLAEPLRGYFWTRDAAVIYRLQRPDSSVGGHAVQ